MSLLKTLEKMPFKTLLALSVMALLVLTLPVIIWLSQQQTRLATKAYFEKPKPIISVQKYGAASQNNPRISLVWPFLGKIGDAVLIEGENFGDNPQDKKLIIGNILVPEEKINKWTNKLIVFNLPDDAVSGLISLTVASKKADWPYFFTLYSKETKTRVTESNDIVRVLNAQPRSKIDIFFSNTDKIEATQLENIPVPGDKTIISVVVKDNGGNPQPFFVEPEEFGF